MHYRTLLLIVALGGIGLATLWHRSVRFPHSSSPRTSWADTVQTASASSRPEPVSDPSPSKTESLQRVERLYRLQADLMQARAQQNAERVESILHTAFRELTTLTQQPHLTKRPRFRHAFQTFTNEYQSRYGVPDTLHLPRHDNKDLQTGLFSALNRETPPSITSALPADLRKQNGPVPLTMNRAVKKSIAFLLENKERYLYPWLQRASTYFPMIEQIFAEEGIPDEIKYLALAESGLDPHARSRAHAYGIWQFVAETGRRYGLSIDPWVDERLDPEKSTRAAAHLLNDLHDRFGDWQLALAGYNCDPGVVEYHIQEYKERTGQMPSFWDIYDDLPEETRNYVPLFTATAVIISNPSAFDLRRVQAGPRYAFDYVPVEAALTIERTARLAEVAPEKVRVLNPELRTNRLPASEHPYYVRLPYGTYSTFIGNLKALPEEARRTRLEHVVQDGETVGRIAQRYQVDRSDLLDANEIASPFGMTVGERLTVPDKRYKGNARVAEAARHQPIRVRYGSRTVRPLDSDPTNNSRLTALRSPQSSSGRSSE